jgi:SRSO17 transposase
VTISQFERKQGQLRAALEAAAARLAPHFPNPAAAATAAAYLQSLLSQVERKNSWQLAEAAGLANPYAFQHLLGRAQWDAEAVRDAQRQEVLAGLGQEDAVLAIDESGVVKQGTKSAGVARQYCGASGKIDNCQVGVFLSWQTAKGHALSRSGALPAAGMDRRPGALSGGRHSRGRDLCDQTRVGPPLGRAGLGRGRPAGLGGGRRRVRG